MGTQWGWIHKKTQLACPNGVRAIEAGQPANQSEFILIVTSTRIRTYDFGVSQASTINTIN